MVSIFITGTDTGVGKTVLSLMLMHYFLKRGNNPFYLKPVQTGCRHPHEEESDAAFVYRHLPPFRGRNPAEAVGLCFPHPKAPFFAARDAGVTILEEQIKNLIAEKKTSFSPLIVEFAGGLLVPLTESLLNIDLLRPEDQVLLAARASLGTINHTLLSLEALKRRNIIPLGVIFLDPLGTPPDMIKENGEAIRKYGGISVVGTIGPIEDFSFLPALCETLFDKLFSR